LDICAILFSNPEIVLDRGALYRYSANHMMNGLSAKSGKNRMRRIHLIAAGTAMMFTLTAAAQQSPNASDSPGRGGVPTVEEQLKVLSEKLDLTRDQRAKIQPFLQELHKATERIVEDKSLSHEERLAQVRPWRYEADKKIRAVLNDDQKRKLDD
jgi:Spy/CpxP family protein refolding chaperone